MASERELLPLFPLNTVLFPYSRMQLHVFELRYREMIEHCLQLNVPFGVVLIRAGEEVGATAEPYLVGTKVRILDLFRYEDGRYDLTVEGVERFRIREISHERSFLQGAIENIHELEDVDEDHLMELAAQARHLGELLVKEHVDNKDFAVKVLFPEDPIQLSFALANMIEFPALRKQFFLELDDTSVRLEAILEVLNQLALNLEGTMKRLTSQDLREWVTPN
jgi:Lon protease-like protein